MNKASIITAHRTNDGRSVYLGSAGVWETELPAAQPWGDPAELEAQLAWARTQEAILCDATTLEVGLDDATGKPIPLSAREQIRWRAPAWLRERFVGAGAVASLEDQPSAASLIYNYDELDRAVVRERAQQFRHQVQRRLRGDITEDEFKPLRLQNGLYLQLHAYMLRIVIPYGQLTANQLRALARITLKYDRGYGHFTTRQNIQLNWLKLEDVPAVLDDLAAADMHAIQGSGNCIRNTTSDPLAGVAADEILDPRPYCELIRQWSTFHPEFAFLPRKFKIAVSGARQDRAAIRVHDIGVRGYLSETGTPLFEVFVGGGLGRTPAIAPSIKRDLPEEALLSYLEAVLRVYNQQGRRDDKYKARIKILVAALGPEVFAAAVEKEWELIKDGPLRLAESDIAAVRERFSPPSYESTVTPADPLAAAALNPDRTYASWVAANTFRHRIPGYVSVALVVKSRRHPPGDLTAADMEKVANLADRYSQGRLVVTHRQNLVFPDVRADQLQDLHRELRELDLAAPIYGQASDVIACPGLDYCALANARSIPVAEEIAEAVRQQPDASSFGKVTINVSGCINACGHHHVGNLGILGINKGGTEFYQLMLGGSSADDASLGKVLGPALAADKIVPAVVRVLERYRQERTTPNETFVETYRRVGPKPFAESAYASVEES